TEEFDSDAFGNVLAYRSPERVAAGSTVNSTSATYDSSKTFPDVVTRPVSDDLSLVDTYRFDTASGVLVKHLDPNGMLQCWTYDGFYRLQERRRHSAATTVGTTCNTQLEQFVYSGIPSPTSQRIEGTQYSGTQTIGSTRYFDGLGRVYREEYQMEGGKYS